MNTAEGWSASFSLWTHSAGQNDTGWLEIEIFHARPLRSRFKTTQFRTNHWSRVTVTALTFFFSVFLFVCKGAHLRFMCLQNNHWQSKQSKSTKPNTASEYNTLTWNRVGKDLSWVLLLPHLCPVHWHAVDGKHGIWRWAGGWSDGFQS